MKLYYILNSRLPTEKAHGYQISKMCEEFSKAGIEVELWLPQRKNPISEDLFSFYNIKRNFKVRYIRCPDIVRYSSILGKFAFWLQEVFFIFAARRIPIEHDSIIYSRDSGIIFIYSRMNYKTIYDAHNFTKHNIRIFLKLLSRVSKIIANTSGTATEFIKRGFTNLLVAPNGVDLEAFSFKKDVFSLREELDLPRNFKIAMYVGHLYVWKGIDVILKAAQNLKDRSDIKFVLVGGTLDDIKNYRQIIENRRISNVLFLGYQKKDRIPFYLKAADVLLLPNIPSSKESESYTSPIKMFEYMASGVPIIASDLPSIREALDNETAYLFKAGDSLELSSAIEKAFSDKTGSRQRAENAKEKSKKFSWSKRAQSILEFIVS